MRTLAAVSDGRPVVLADWADMGHRAQAALALSAALVVAAPGAGNVNALFVRPGTAGSELVPPGSMMDAAMYLAIAQRLGIRWYTLPLIASDPGPHNSPRFHRYYDVDHMPLRQFAALALGTEA